MGVCVCVFRVLTPHEIHIQFLFQALWPVRLLVEVIRGGPMFS